MTGSAKSGTVAESKSAGVLDSTVVSAKINFLYPEGPMKFNGKKMAEARDLIGRLREGDAELRGAAGSALDNAVLRAVEDAMSSDAGVRAIAYCYFNNVRESGTQEEKDRAFQFLASHIEICTASQPKFEDAERVGRAANMLLFLFETRAIESLQKASGMLTESESEKIRGIGHRMDETIFVLHTEAGLRKKIAAGEKEFREKMLG